MANANRALSAPINIHCDHSDIMGARDTGWVILLRRDGAGGLRQHDHGGARRRAPRRAAAGHEHARRLHHDALHRPRRDDGRRDGRRRSSASTCRSTRCSTSTNPVEPRQLRRPRRAVLRVQAGAAAARSTARGRHRRASAPSGRRALADGPSASIETLGHGGRRRSRSSSLGSTAGNARHVARELRGEGRQGRRRQDPRASARSRTRRSPRRSRAPRPSRCSTVPRASAPRAVRCSSRCAARCTTWRSACPVVDYIYGLGGADVKTRAHRAACTRDLSDIAERRAEPRAASSTSARGREEEHTWRTIKELSHREEGLEGGHRLCARLRRVDRGAPGAARPPATCRSWRAARPGCLEVSTTIYPYSSWKVPFIHNAFENAARDDLRRRGGVQGSQARRQDPGGQGGASSSRSAATAAPTTSACSRSPAPWSAATTWCTCATTTART